MKKRLILSILVLLFSWSVKAYDYSGQKNISKPENYIFGYGSLVNSKSRAETLNCLRSVVAARISSKFGYQRVWNYPAPGFTALGVVKSENPMSINGIIYIAHDDELKVWDDRETNYNRIEVPWDYVESVDWMQLPKEGKLWIYIPKNVQLPNKQYPLVQSYIDTCVSGFLEYSEDFAIEFLHTTGGWSQFWLNDRLLARRHWVHFKEHAIVDRLLKEYPAQENMFDKRSYLPDWG